MGCSLNLLYGLHHANQQLFNSLKRLCEKLKFQANQAALKDFKVFKGFNRRDSLQKKLAEKPSENV